jgi:hypothetical protein
MEGFGVIETHNEGFKHALISFSPANGSISLG